MTGWKLSKLTKEVRGRERALTGQKSSEEDDIRQEQIVYELASRFLKVILTSVDNDQTEIALK